MADRRLQVFHAVAKQHSFTKAADALLMTQPAVTFQVKQLEEHFNTRLFDRGHGKITLTPAGELVLAYAERILGLSAELDSRVFELTDDLAGQLKIGASTTIAAYWLPQILEGFKRRYPGVLPRVVVGTSKLTEDRVAARDLDIGLIEIATEQHTIERRSSARDELLVSPSRCSHAPTRRSKSSCRATSSAPASSPPLPTTPARSSRASPARKKGSESLSWLMVDASGGPC